MIRALENTLTKNGKLKIESFTWMDEYFIICQYKTEKTRNFETSAHISLGFFLVWNKHIFSRSKVTVFQTYNKKYGIKNAVTWVEILQLHRYTITIITWFYLKTRIRLSKALRNIKKISIHAHFLLRRPFYLF